jgi:ubiquinone/menaquinone biosynthesis C-methylase UbiE
VSRTSPTFARIYDKFFTGFAGSVQEPMAAYLDRRAQAAGLPRVLLDLCCGTGQLACGFADRGYRVFGVDREAAMLEVARRKVRTDIAAAVTFLEGDATSFDLPERVSFATSTFDALNYLPDLPALTECFRRVRSVVRDQGAFVFDMHTLYGLEQINDLNLRDGEEEMFVSRVVYDPTLTRVVARTSGFALAPDGSWERFAEVVVQTAYKTDDVVSALLSAGWNNAWPAGLADLSRPLPDPEGQARSFFVAEA